MAEKRQVTLSGEEVSSAARKLEKFGQEQLTLNEQMVVDWLLQRAASAPVDDPEGDVRAYLSAGQRNPARTRAFPRRFTQALGYGPAVTNPADLAAVRISISI